MRTKPWSRGPRWVTTPSVIARRATATCLVLAAVLLSGGMAGCRTDETRTTGRKWLCDCRYAPTSELPDAELEVCALTAQTAAAFAADWAACGCAFP